MSVQSGQARLASEDVIISAPMSYVGSARRIIRLRRRAEPGPQLAAITALAVLLIVVVWVFVTVWYLTWGIFLVPYRLKRRSDRRHKVEALRHRELMGTIEGSAAASAAAIVSATVSAHTGQPDVDLAGRELIGDADREYATAELRLHLVAGRVTTEEFEVRVAAVHAARTRAELAAARAGLPRVAVGP